MRRFIFLFLLISTLAVPSPAKAYDTIIGDPVCLPAPCLRVYQYHLPFIVNN